MTRLRMKGGMFLAALVLALGLFPAMALADTPLSDCKFLFTDKQHQNADDEWWQIYGMKDKATSAKPTFALYDDGAKVSADKYTVSYRLTWWDVKANKDKSAAVSADKLTAASKHGEGGASEYWIVVKAKAGSGYTGEYKFRDMGMYPTICVVDKQCIGRFSDAVPVNGKASWRFAINGMNSNYWVVPAAKAKAGLKSWTVKQEAGPTKVKASKLKITYYQAKKTAIKKNDIDHAKTGKALKGVPTTAGAYVAYIKGVKPYYGTVIVAIDIQDKMANAKVTVKDTKKGKAPKLTVTYKGATLKKGTDYKVTYKDAKGKTVKAKDLKKGSYKLVVEGCNPIVTFGFDEDTGPGMKTLEQDRFFTGKVTKSFKVK